MGEWLLRRGEGESEVEGERGVVVAAAVAKGTVGNGSVFSPCLAQ
jgi:hypothetical protein